MRLSHRRRLTAVLAVAVLVVTGTAVLVWRLTRTSPPPTAAPANDVIASLWEWPWVSVGQECSRVLGPAGYGAVQVAPPEDSLDASGHPWWDVYQPVGYDLDSRFGTRTEFAAMVSACHAAGVRVYVDAVINHMTGADQAGPHGYGPATFSPDRHYPGAGYTPGDFHSYPGDCPTSDGQIADWTNVRQVQNCELLGLADLRTESDYVRDQIAGYLNDMMSLGVDGFRIDAAKHIPVADLAAIKAKLTRTPAFWVQEVQPGSPPMADYEGLGSVLEFGFASNLRGQFRTGISGLEGFGTGGVYEPSDKAVVFVSNHDTERDGSTLSYQDGAVYDLATMFMLAWNYGTPTVHSSFTFTGFDQSPPADATGHVTPVSCGAQWSCVHSRPAITGLVGFHNATHADPTVGHWWSDGADAIAFSRGPAQQSTGWIALNAATTPLSERGFSTGLAAGTYCDVVHGQREGDHCTGPSVTIAADGTAQVGVGPVDAVAIDAASRLP